MSGTGRAMREHLSPELADRASPDPVREPGSAFGAPGIPLAAAGAHPGGEGDQDPGGCVPREGAQSPGTTTTAESRAAQRKAWKAAISAKNATQRRGRARRPGPSITGVVKLPPGAR